mmetsp:Transcript_922/g.3182  ORF Transcript_922/g.3182 Transcript_922/m.3182 type:complete len:120 (+) Transcript_922:287-646(+)
MHTTTLSKRRRLLCHSKLEEFCESECGQHTKRDNRHAWKMGAFFRTPWITPHLREDSKQCLVQRIRCIFWNHLLRLWIGVPLHGFPQCDAERGISLAAVVSPAAPLQFTMRNVFVRKTN